MVYIIKSGEEHRRWEGDDRAVVHLRLAAAGGAHDGRDNLLNELYLTRCRLFHKPSRALLLFTKDIGMHSSGWMKNPDFERCRHLSVSFRDPETLAPEKYNPVVGEAWARRLFGDHVRYAWVEPPYSEAGKEAGVWHFRVFYDPSWRNAIVPRGEPYSRQNTPPEWRSYTELLALREAVGP